MMRVLLTHNRDLLKHFYGERAVRALKALPIELVMNDSDEPLTGDALVKAAEGCQVVISDRLAAGPRAVMEQLKDVKLFTRCAVDMRNIDVDAASDAGILVCNCGSGYADAVAEHALALMLDLARNITHDAERYHAGQATHPMVFGRQLAGAHVGVIGYGSIGRRIVELALAFKMKVSVYDPYARIDNGAINPVGLDEVLGTPDFVVCAAYATPQTNRMMNAEAFAKMRADAFFINISRGILVDEDALEHALTNGIIAGAGLDVGDGPDQQPSLRLARLPNVVATPHSAALMIEPSEFQAMETVEQVKAMLAGKLPIHAKNPHRVRGLFEA
ncbi:hydroxyacid dehydrogenase [Acetobacter sp. TBRC 12305]|uniref:Hydroxyacid dehydrogenase n=1 Tax=Acetobacter garciniae TaxID=2817435 RepID=A0A939HLH6_9PROT|nr:NAD(P)-dependent oxidoreductase [Acetobacter garciniae]MBO1325697.1 hydroxyacid dehydrogenase [Acetobacter garciniae]MBX0345597.1 hydroxyacid dehydrogenase [Acetobacter garciniae]